MNIELELRLEGEDANEETLLNFMDWLEMKSKMSETQVKISIEIEPANTQVILIGASQFSDKKNGYHYQQWVKYIFQRGNLSIDVTLSKTQEVRQSVGFVFYRFKL